MAKLKATVLFDYDAEAPDELTLRVGDVLNGIKHIEEGWCQGTLKGKTGMFPDNFVKIEEEKLAPPKSSATKAKKDVKRVKVTFAYDPLNDDELKLSVGDIVEILKEEEEGWARGRLKDKEGVFPTNFTVPFTKSPSTTRAAGEGMENEEMNNHVAQKKETKGIGYGNIFAEGPKTTKQVTHKDDGDKSETKKVVEVSSVTAKTRNSIKVTVKDKEEKSPTSAKREKSTIKKCRVTFDYKATTEDELSLVKGDIVTLITKDCADDGWWEGEVKDKNGRTQRGVFPDNFVVLLSSAEDVNEDVVDGKPAENNSKSHPDVQESPSQAKGKSNSGALKDAASLKSSTPQLPEAEEINNASASDYAAFTNSSTEEQQLTHFKRPGGPKNRRKPDSTGRRERAKESNEDFAANAPLEVLDNKEPEVEPSPPQVASKRDPMRGIQVMPTPSGGGNSGEKPSWMKDLKSRASLKKTGGPLALSPNKPEENTNDKPAWLSNLRKTPKSDDKSSVSPASSKPSPGVTSPKPVSHSLTPKSSHHMPASTHVPPVRPPSPDKSAEEKNDKPWSIKLKSKGENGALTGALVDTPSEGKTDMKHTPETKKLPLKPHFQQQLPVKPPIELSKKPAAPAKPKPPPPKTKPALPGSKPSSASMDELREDIKALKEHFASLQAESQKEINRLNKELDEEKKHRISLQAEVTQLRKQIG